MVKSRSYSPLRYAPWCFRDRRAVVADVDRVVRILRPGALHVRPLGLALGHAAAVHPGLRPPGRVLPAAAVAALSGRGEPAMERSGVGCSS